ncbi:hypothetical protein [uncultured Maribacter sp.]|uniref:hypothetical protein n=1 Tax=uncultured Maribacter sp. TaxID=431308 RepID=UPI0030DAF981
MKTIIALLFVCIGYSANAQTNLNDYKYIIVPKKFDSFKETNEFQTSTLIKYILKGKGFNVVYDDALPSDLNSNRCLGLMVNLQDDSSLFTTKTIIVLKDCNDNTIFTSMQGTSKAKQFKEAYTESIREAMRSFNGIDYAYNEKSEKNETVTVSFRNDVKKLDKEKIDEISNVESAKVQEESNSKIVSEEATDTTQYYKDNTPVDSNIKKEERETTTFKKVALKKLNVNDIWYAQATNVGFQLVDSTPKVRMNLLRSSADNIFLGKTDTKNGIVYQKEGSWIFEYYENDKLVQEELNIKF